MARVFLLADTWPILQPGLHDRSRVLCHLLDLLTWLLFAADYVLRVALARHRGRYITRHLPDVW